MRIKRKGLNISSFWVVVSMLIPITVQGQGIDLRVDSMNTSTRWGAYQTSSSMDPDFIVDSPHTAPEWALLERALLRASSRACKYYFDRYFDARGFLLTDIRWGADDGPDDGFESINRWPQLYALGGTDKILDMYNKAYDGMLRQMSKQYSTATGSPLHIPYIVDGMYYKEFITRADWMHNSEGITAFNMMGLGDPYDVKFRHRVTRFAGFYMNGGQNKRYAIHGGYPRPRGSFIGKNLGAPNYDSEHKIIRSMYNGSRGPLMRRTNSLDWAGDVSEVRNRYAAGHGESSFEGFLYHFKDYYNTIGDVPLNLLSTTLAYNAYALTGEKGYRRWLLEYVDAWYDRMKANNWVIPSNVGLDGTIGGATDGKWYGGTYGWSFTVKQQNPPGQGLSDRERTRWGFTGFMNAYVLTGDKKYLQAWRNQNKVIYDAGKMIDGVYQTPRMYGNPHWSREGYTDEDGWYSFRPYKAKNENMVQLYYLSMNQADRKYIKSNPWLEFLEGSNPDYAVNAIRADLADVNERMKLLKQDNTSPDMRLLDDPMDLNPASITSLIRLMEGGLYEPALSRRSPPSYVRLRYFDPAKRRPGMPKDIAALVTGMTAQSVTVKLVNLNPVEAHPLIVQGGAYGEHQIVSVTPQNDSDKRISIDDSSFKILLEPGAGTTLKIVMDRFANQPTMDFPWRRRK